MNGISRPVYACTREEEENEVVTLTREVARLRDALERVTRERDVYMRQANAAHKVLAKEPVLRARIHSEIMRVRERAK
jgi:hypothetical protein